MNLTDYKPAAKFSRKHLLCLQEYTPDEILQLLSLALKLKSDLKRGLRPPILADKVLGLYLTKSSLRTRVSFEVGMLQLGGKALLLNPQDIRIGERESVADVSRVISRYLDALMIRTFKQSDVEGLARHGSIPIINGLTDDYHPCQALADILTVYEYKGRFEGVSLAYIGDGNNVAHSLMIACSKLGMNMTLSCPMGYEPAQRVVDWARANNNLSGGSFAIEHDPNKAVERADVVYTDVWSSMGQESEQEARAKAFAPYQVNAALMARAKADATFEHCLPAHRGQEVTDDVMDSPQSVVFDQAENRMHAQKAVLAMLMKDEGVELW